MVEELAGVMERGGLRLPEMPRYGSGNFGLASLCNLDEQSGPGTVTHRHPSQDRRPERKPAGGDCLGPGIRAAEESPDGP